MVLKGKSKRGYKVHKIRASRKREISLKVRLSYKNRTETSVRSFETLKEKSGTKEVESETPGTGSVGTAKQGHDRHGGAQVQGDSLLALLGFCGVWFFKLMYNNCTHLWGTM